ncbi:glycosyltransferase family 2 protein [Bernardetia sp. ABR2-2B]|uniref:glycosyltransferase family 2 protein n=1 Tax=Bernardetia sp. ABR2-2B TaxID=3127472 RepID=UPI0030D0879D
MLKDKLLSLIVPVYFEEECIEQFITETTKVLEEHSINYEIIFIDDGSKDNTVELIKAQALNNKNLKLIEFSYNHGKQAALTAGITYAEGDYLLMMDPDLQDPPIEIPSFIRKIEEGYDLVFGVRKEKKDNIINVIFSKLFWWILERFTGLNLPRGLAVMRIFNRRFTNQFLKYNESSRFIEGMFMHVGMKQATITIEQRERFAGVSKFNFSRKLNLAFDAILDFSDLPLKNIIRIGSYMVAFGFFAAFFIVIAKLLLIDFQMGWASIMVSMLIGFGIQLIMMGIVGVYVGKIYKQVKQRPLYSVKTITNLADK